MGLNFTGMTLAQLAPLNGGNYAPPDTMGAVGNSHIVQFVNGGFRIFDKSTGAGVVSALTPGGAPITDTAFWSASGATNVNSLSDPRVIFDRSSQRWIAAQITTNESVGNRVLVARSNTADPTAGWISTSFVPTTTNFADFPTLSLNADGIFIGTNNFTSSTGSFTNVSLIGIPKADILAATPTVANRTVISGTTSTIGFTPQAALDFGVSTGRNAVYGVSTNTTLRRVNVANLLTPPGSLSGSAAITVASASTSTNYSLQPDGTVQLDNGDNRISGNVVKIGDRVYMVRAVGAGARSAIRITVLSESTDAVLAETTISDTNRDYMYPSISANSAGDIVIGFSRSGSAAGEFAGSYGRTGSFNGTTFTLDSGDTLLKAGTANYHLFGGTGERFGDYSATVSDPNDPNSFWTFQEFAAGATNWGTQITNIRVGAVSVPEPGTGSLLVYVAFSVACFVVRRKR